MPLGLAAWTTRLAWVAGSFGASTLLASPSNSIESGLLSMAAATPANLESYYTAHENEGLAKPLLGDEAPINEQASPESAELGHAVDPRRSQGGHSCKAAAGRRCTAWQTTAALLTLQLGWGLWLLPCDFARLGWIPGFVTLFILALLTTYSGTLFTRLYAAVPEAVLFGDIGAAAVGRKGRMLVYFTIYSLDATRCIILHLAATQSLFHAIAPVLEEALPLWQCSVIVGVVVLLLGQIRYLTQLSSFFLAGTVSQMIALTIVIYDLVISASRSSAGSGTSPPRGVEGGRATGLVRHSPLIGDDVLNGNWAPAAMAVLNMIFAYGGQFAFLELITSMKSPDRFSYAVTFCTAIMTALYGGFGAVGYWSKGSSVHGIVIFNMDPSPLAQVAAGFIFLQALAQYLVNLNVWTHNLLVLISRRATRNTDDELWAEETHAKNTGDHSSSHWLAATAFVAAYSAVVAVAIPFFCTLVGFVTSVTYLTCAYTLPAWFAIKLLGGSKLGGLERAWLTFLIPVSIILSSIGFVASVKTYITEAYGGEGM